MATLTLVKRLLAADAELEIELSELCEPKLEPALVITVPTGEEHTVSPVGRLFAVDVELESWTALNELELELGCGEYCRSNRIGRGITG